MPDQNNGVPAIPQTHHLLAAFSHFGAGVLHFLAHPGSDPAAGQHLVQAIASGAAAAGAAGSGNLVGAALAASQAATQFSSLVSAGVGSDADSTAAPAQPST